MCKVLALRETNKSVKAEIPSQFLRDHPSRDLMTMHAMSKRDETSMGDVTKKESEEKEFGRIAQTFAAAIGRCARSYAKSSAEREDLEQDIALAIWRALPGFRRECSERTFVLRIAHNQALSSLTKRRSQGVTEELDEEARASGPDPEMLADLTQRMRKVFEALHALPFGQRQVLALTLEGLSHEEIAEVTGASVGNVAVRVSRARTELRKLLGEKS